MHISNIKKSFSILSIALIVFSYLLTSGVLLFKPQMAKAASFTVTKVADTNDGTCDADCSLREAITAANGSAGADTIAFAIPGAGVHTIVPLTPLPVFTQQITVDGTTQPGWVANSAVSPAPFNGTLQIEIDGTSAGVGANGLHLFVGSDNSIVRGLVINRFGGQGITVGSQNVTVAGNYLGTDPTGLVDQGNGLNGVSNDATGNADNLTIGGTSPADRNIISGNDGGGASPNTGDDNWIIEGNYIGVGATGVTAIPNSVAFGSGALSLDNSNGHIVGGTTAASKNVISGNNSMGIAPNNVDDLTIQGNYIGTDYTGTATLGNGGGGISLGTVTNAQIGGTTSVTVGGNCTGACNIISDNGFDGIFAGDGVATTTIEGNYIGTDITGTVYLGNTNNGVLIGGAAENTTTVTVGGTTDSARNIISGNGTDGVSITGADTTANVVAGNYIGTDVSGALDRGNTDDGVSIFNSANNNTIGGDTAGERNVISGNTTNGVSIDGANNNTVQGNYIGTDAAGTANLGNASNGIYVINSATSNTIGGDTAGERNVISGNITNGVSIDGANNNTVQGNYIGTDQAGTADLGNTSNGVYVANSATSNTIGGDTAGERNIISGNNGDGIQIDTADSNTASGNYIGTDETGTADLGNTSYGVTINDSDTNTIGGNTSDTRNVISGNNVSGVQITGTSSTNTISGNFIGTNASGASAITNTTYGVHIVDTATSNTIGGTTGVTLGGSCTGACNVISGNANNHGIFLQGSGGNTIAGNFVGIDVTGMVDVGNGGSGIHDAASGSNTIGGTSTGSRNVASGNVGMGIELQGDSTIVQGNYVGLNTDGSGVLPNDGGSNGSQVFISGDDIQFGGTTTSARNIVSGDANNGIRLIGLSAFGGSSAENNKIQGNCIGTNANCQVETGFGFAEGGLGIAGDAVNTLVGGTESGAGNIIAGNGYGIGNLQLEIPGPGPFPVPGTYQPINNSFVGNSIYQNTGGTLSTIGIDNAQTVGFVIFSEQNVTPNDANDIDADGDNTGPNHYLNFPEISSVTSTNGTATITYNLDINDTEAGATGYRVEFFANDAADPSGNGQGQTYLGSDTIPAADVTGRQATITLPAGVEGNKFISAVTTMTDASADGFGHSSEFAADVEATLVPAVTPADLLASTGKAIKWLALIAAILLATGGAGLYIARKRQKI